MVQAPIYKDPAITRRTMVAMIEDIYTCQEADYCKPPTRPFPSDEPLMSLAEIEKMVAKLHKQTMRDRRPHFRPLPSANSPSEE